MRIPAIVVFLLACVTLSRSGLASEDAVLRVLILSGQNNHAWEETTPKIRAVLEETGRFHVEVTETPEALTSQALEDLDVLVSNWNTFPRGKDPVAVAEWPDVAQRAILDFVGEGKGHVVVHAGGSSFTDWFDYQRMIAGGGWTLGQTSHGPRHAFPVRSTSGGNAIGEGMGEFYTFDELWNDTGIGEDAAVVAEAFSSKKHGGPDDWETVAAANRFGKGRNFTVLLGHDVVGMSNPGFRDLLVRGTEWAATGQVTIPVSDKLLRTRREAEALRRRVSKSLNDARSESK